MYYDDGVHYVGDALAVFGRLGGLSHFPLGAREGNTRPGECSFGTVGTAQTRVTYIPLPSHTHTAAQRAFTCTCTMIRAVPAVVFHLDRRIFPPSAGGLIAPLTPPGPSSGLPRPMPTPGPGTPFTF